MKSKKFQYVICSTKSSLKDWATQLKAGFLLLEIMVALIVLGALSIVVAKYEVSIVRWNKESHDYFQAAHVAAEACERLAFVQDSKGSDAYSIGSFHIEHIVKDCIIPNQCEKEGLTTQRLKKFKMVQVKVSWVAMGGQNKSILFESAGRVDLRKNI